MRKQFSTLLAGLLALALLFGLFPAAGALASDSDPASGRIVVANRGEGTISIIEARSGVLLDTVPLPAGEATPEPMYVVYTPAKNQVWVGDRSNDRVVAFDARTFDVAAVVPTAAGVFHMWADSQEGQLWVVADRDKAISVVDTITGEVIETIPIPADLVAQGGIPHDVILDPVGVYAYVAVNGVAGPNSYVVQYSTRTFEELGRAAVGRDAHLSLARQDDQLYVPSQESGVVTVLNRETLEQIAEIPIPGAHGAGMAKNGKVFYTTNLPGGGDQGIFTIDTETNSVIGMATDTPYPVPHNIALTPDGSLLYVTHSGPQDKVTIYSASTQDPVPVLIGEVTVGLNPFGLSYVP